LRRKSAGTGAGAGCADQHRPGGSACRTRSGGSAPRRPGAPSAAAPRRLSGATHVSDFLAVAGVTTVLRWLLREAVTGSGVDTAVGATPTISALPPDRIVVGATEIPQLNIFMYHVSINSGWRNFGLPELDASGRRVSAPPLAIDLHFLLSAYGPNELDGEILLGWAMQVMHEQP